MPSCAAIERRPLWPANPPPMRAWSRPGLEVALVVDDEDRVRLELVERRRGLHRAAGLVHVRLGLQQADAVLVDADVGELAGELAAPRAAVPARELVHDHVADVVAVALVLATRVAETDHQQVERRGTFAPTPRQAHGQPSVGVFAASAAPSAASPSAAGSSPSAAASSPSATSSTSGSSTRVGCVTLASTVSSGSSRKVTPAGAAISERRIESPMPQRRDVDLDVLRHLERQRLDVDLVRHLGEHAALLDAGRLADERDHDGGLDRLVEPDLLEVDVRDRAAHLVALVVLEDRRVLAAAVDGDVEHDVAAGRGRQRGAQLALADRDRDGLGAAVEDARNDALLAQAPGFGGSEDGPLGNLELDALSCHGAPV